jgi:hypothetical protein
MGAGGGGRYVVGVRGSRGTAAALCIVVVASVVAFATTTRDAGAAGAPAWLPRVQNFSHLTDARATALADEALRGLGFAPGAWDGPRPEDRVFVGDAYVAWIDETGFFGKLNGLWWLAPTTSGDRSFTMRGADGRPINQLIVGEAGDGAWPKGYRGAEHIEMPNNTPQLDDNQGCAQAGRWCSQFSLDEAGRYTQPGIPWWNLCDPGALGYLEHQEPVEVQATASTLRLVYEARLVKRAGGHWPWSTTTHCHDDWLFPDGERRPVYLRVGYELHADLPQVDRLMQVRNPEGNPDFAGPFSFIGGFVITTWPNPMPEKQLNAFVRPELTDFGDPYLNRPVVAGVWNTGWSDPIGKDIAFGWLRQPFTLSAVPGAANGRSLRLSLLGPSDNLDAGLCLCQSHGGLEMGGGLLHTAPAEDAALPLAGGALSIEAKRRLETAPATVIPDVPPWTGNQVPTTTTTSMTTTSMATSTTTSTTNTPSSTTTSSAAPAPPGGAAAGAPSGAAAPAAAAVPVVARVAFTG